MAIETLVNPKPGDRDNAEAILDEITEVLKKHRALLIHKSDCIVLAIHQPHSNVWRAIAQVRSMSYLVMDWRPVTWDSPKPQTVGRPKPI